MSKKYDILIDSYQADLVIFTKQIHTNIFSLV